MNAIHWRKGRVPVSLYLRKPFVGGRDQLRAWAEQQGIKGTVKLYDGPRLVLRIAA